MKTGVWLAFWALTAAASAAENGYIDTRVCATCHPKIYESWRKTGMARSFYKPDTADVAEARYYHQASDTWFSIAARDGGFIQRRWQIGFGGRETNVDEQTIDFVIGSGARVRTYLHRTPTGALQELPLAWYAEKGGVAAMNPCYDKPDQPNARRKINYECMFCHNSYPEIPAGHEQAQAEPRYSGALPEGIDCQRCHGPGQQHVQTARRAGASAEAIRSAVVNPARLDSARRMEICLQCHLETTSFPFTHSIVKYARGPFSFRPGEKLADFMLFFDHAPASAQDDRFQIVNSAYRLRMSQCFLKSRGALECTTCHDPHGGDQNAPRDYNRVCRDCHTAAHRISENCVSCHMPKRRTEDVVHAMMTDHFIQRRKPAGDLVADIPERDGPDTFYHGRALPYYPQPFPAGPESALYLGVAQVHANNNPERGIPELSAALAKYRPKQPEFYVELADALRNNGRPKEAIAHYRSALELRPESLAALLGLGQSLAASGDFPNALAAFRKGTTAAPDDAFAWQQLGQTLLKLGMRNEAETALGKSIANDAAVPEAHYALATLLSGPDIDAARAEAEWREAIRLQPDYAQARMNLAIFLSQHGQAAEAAYHFEYALRVRPDYGLAHLNYALMLRSQGRDSEAAVHLRKAAESNDASVREAARKLYLTH